MLNFREKKKLQQSMLQNNLEALLITYQPNVFYTSGFTGTSGYILLTLEEAFLYTDSRYLQQARDQAPSFEVVKVTSSYDFQVIVSLLRQKNIKQLAVEEEHLTLRDYNRLKTTAGDNIELQPVQNFVQKIRTKKEESEIKLIAQAAAKADKALRDTMSILKPNISEIDVACELEYRLRKNGSEKVPFDVIVASGYRSSLPHGVASSKIIKEGELVVVDFGAVVGGYCSDMTRSFVIGAPSKEQQKIYDTVLNAQELTLSSIEPGENSADIDKIARNYFQKFGYSEFFGHGLGHGVGIEVHEEPVLSPKGDSMLEPGMVFTIEPGIYFEGWGGIRIEDLVVIREDKIEVLTKSSKEFVPKL